MKNKRAMCIGIRENEWSKRMPVTMLISLLQDCVLSFPEVSLVVLGIFFSLFFFSGFDSMKRKPSGALSYFHNSGSSIWQLYLWQILFFDCVTEHLGGVCKHSLQWACVDWFTVTSTSKIQMLSWKGGKGDIFVFYEKRKSWLLVVKNIKHYLRGISKFNIFNNYPCWTLFIFSLIDLNNSN